MLRLAAFSLWLPSAFALAAPANSADDFTLYRASLAAAENSLRLHDTARAREWLAITPPAFRHVEWQWLNRQSAQSEWAVPAHSGRLLALQLSPDRQWLVSTGADQTARLWRVPDLQAGPTLKGHGAAVWQAAWSPDSERLVTVSSDGTLRIWNRRDGAQLVQVDQIGRGMASVVWRANGEQIITSSWKVAPERGVYGLLQWWDAHSGKLLRSIEHAVKPLVVAALSHDDKLLAVGDWDDNVALFDADSGALLRTLTPPPDDQYKAVQHLAFSPDDQQLAVTGKDGVLRVWDVTDGRLRSAHFQQSEGERQWLNAVLWTPGKHLITGGGDQTLRRWSLAQSGSTAIWHAHTAPVNALAVNGDQLYSGDAAGHIHRWSLAKRSAETPWALGESQFGLAYSPDSRQLAVTGWKGGLQILDAANGKTLRAIAAHGISGVRVDWSRDGKLLASTGNDGAVRLWQAGDLSAAGELLKLPGGRSNGVAFLPDSRHLAAASGAGAISLWQLDAAARASARHTASPPAATHTWRIGASTAQDLIWQDACRCLLAPGHDGVSWLLPVTDVQNLVASAPVALRSSSAASAAAAHAALIYTAHADGYLRVWSVTGELQRELLLSGDRLSSLSISPDGKRIAVGTEQGSVLLIDRDSLQLLIKPKLDSGVWLLRFTPDGSQLHVLTLDKQLHRLMFSDGPVALRAE